MVSKDSVRRSQSVPASKPVSKTFIIIAISVAALVILGVFLLLTKGQFVGKATFSQVAQQVPTVPTTTETTQPQTTQQEAIPAETSSPPPTSSSDDLHIDLELNRVDRTHSWVNVYLTSASHDQLMGMSLQLKMEGVSGKFTKVELHPLFKSVTSSGLNTGQINFHAVNTVIIPITPSAKTYLGRVYLQNENGAPGTITINLVGTPQINYASSNLYLISMTPLSACAPNGILESSLIPNMNCGAWADGCDGFVDAGSCADGNVCVAKSCKSAGQVLPANAPQHDKAVLKQVSDTLSNNALNKLQKLSGIVNAVKAWLAAQ